MSRRTSEIWTRKLLYPGHTLPTAIGPVMVGTALAWRDGAFAAVPAVLALVAGWLIQFAGVVADNYENLVRQPDDREHPELVDAVRTGLIPLSTMKATMLACYGGALAAGVVLVFLAGWPVVAIGVVSLAASWVYSSGPWPIGRIGLADPLFFLFFGVVSVAGTYYVQAVSFSADAVALSLPIGALITNILIIDDIRDRAFDADKGKRTIAVRFGVRWSRIEFLASLAAAYLLPFWFWRGRGLGVAVLLPLATLPWAVAVLRHVWTHDRFADLVPMTPRAARLMLLYALLLSAGVAIGRLTP
ncbi:MAG: 1,4-dihydroxy-2-naphthoate octaprenyltransferase [Vicinamibacterales bacterium]